MTDALAAAVADAVRDLFAAGEVWRAVELGERGLHALAAAPGPSPSKIDAALVVGRISAVANFQGDNSFARTIAIGAAAAEEARRLGDPLREAAAHDVAGLAHYYADMMWLTETYVEASSLFDKARWLLEPDRPGLAAVIFHQGLIEERLSRLDAADSLFRRAADLAEGMGEELTLSYAVRHLAFGHQRRGDLALALAEAARSLSLRRHLRLRPYLPLTLVAVADIRLARGERVEAGRLYAEALSEARAMRLPCGEIFALLSEAAVARDDSAMVKARELAAAAGVIAGRVGYPRWVKAIERFEAGLS